MKENEEWNRCRRINGDIWTLCIYDCNDNKSCEDQCTTDYKTQMEQCPCEVHSNTSLTISVNKFIKKNCPGGCPCDGFTCIETTTQPDVSTSTAPATTETATTASTTTPAPKNAVLVLSTYDSSNKPMVVTFEGEFITF